MATCAPTACYTRMADRTTPPKVNFDTCRQLRLDFQTAPRQWLNREDHNGTEAFPKTATVSSANGAKACGVTWQQARQSKAKIGMASALSFLIAPIPCRLSRYAFLNAPPNPARAANGRTMTTTCLIVIATSAASCGRTPRHQIAAGFGRSRRGCRNTRMIAVMRRAREDAMADFKAALISFPAIS